MKESEAENMDFEKLEKQAEHLLRLLRENGSREEVVQTIDTLNSLTNQGIIAKNEGYYPMVHSTSNCNTFIKYF